MAPTRSRKETADSSLFLLGTMHSVEAVARNDSVSAIELRDGHRD